jgi:cobalamin biosynthesis Mg chelatase CobN
MSKSEKILSIILLSLFLLSFTSCVTKKKLKESQELATTHILDVTDLRIANFKNTLKGEISEVVSQEVTSKLKEQKESSSTNENETTDVTVNITAEDGKEKSATVGNTTVTSNGADISVKTSSTKAINNQIETLNSEWSQKYDILETSLKTTEMKSEQRDYANLKRIEQLESKLDKQSKETDKKVLSFCIIIIAIVLALLFIAIKYFKVKIPF